VRAAGRPLYSGRVELVPADLPVVHNLAAVADAQQWLRELPTLIEEVRAEFDLRLHPPLHGGSCSWVAPAELSDGTAVIVKIGWPHREMIGEPAALKLWAGDGAVRLIAADPRRHALILAPCVPGLELGRTEVPADERLRIGCEILRLLWSAPPTGEFDRLADVTAEWADLAEERMARLSPGYDPALVTEGVRLLRELPATAPREVLLHGDFNPGNILSAGPAWLAIDPKPMVGDAAYDPWPLLQQIDNPFSYAFPAPQLRNRATTLAHELDLPAERIVAWAVARTVEAALWSAHHNDIPSGADVMTQAHILATL
jgi:streptomycin 6-kinase